MFYLKYTLLWLCYLCVAVILSNCAAKDPLTINKPLFDINDMQCQGSDILWCEGRNRKHMACECIPNNIQIFDYP